MSLSLLRSYPEVDYSTLKNHLRLKVQGVPSDLVNNALSVAIDEFCTESLFWREEMIIYPTIGLTEYPLPNVSNFKMVELTGAKTQDGTPLEIGKDCYMKGYDFIVLSDEIEAAGVPIRLEVALSIASGATTISKMVVDYCAQWITDGAAAILLMMTQDYPWSDAQKGLMYLDKFASGKRQARRMRLNNFTTHHNPKRKLKFF